MSCPNGLDYSNVEYFVVISECQRWGRLALVFILEWMEWELLEEDKDDHCKYRQPESRLIVLYFIWNQMMHHLQFILILQLHFAIPRGLRDATTTQDIACVRPTLRLANDATCVQVASICMSTAASPVTTVSMMVSCRMEHADQVVKLEGRFRGNTNSCNWQQNIQYSRNFLMVS